MMRLILLSVLFLTTMAHGQVAVRGETVYTMAGEPISDGIVLILEGKIAAVGPQSTVVIPDGVDVLDAKVVTPGLIDAHSVVGLSGQYNYEHDQDQLERSKPIQPELRALDGYNAQERLVEWVRGFGVTTLHTGHAPGELISGQTFIVKTTGDTVDEAVMVSEAMLAATLGEAARKEGGKSPGNRSKMMSLLRQALVDAQAYKAAEDVDDPDAQSNGKTELGKETLVRVLDGELPLMITAHRAQDIANALRLAEEFDIPIVLDGASESFLLIDRIKAADVPVIIHPTMMRGWHETENMSFETAPKLVAAGIPVALQSGYEDYVPKTRVVLFEAARSAAEGMTFEEALATITIDAARVLNIEDRVGSLEIGKDGDVALYDGDPFEYTTHCTGVLIEGEIVSEGR